MKFSKGDKVQSKSDLNKVGMIEDIGPFHAGLQYYKVFWGGLAGTKNVPEIDLQIFLESKEAKDNLINGNLAKCQDFQRLITYHRLLRDYPLHNNIYAFNASRTKFYPYQFKPLIKFIDSPNHRVLICDEVGLGKTIEAGLILTEYRARHAVNRVLVVCPSNLTIKWKLELQNRFDESFNIFNVKSFLEYLDEYEKYPDRVEVNGIISIESCRSSRVLTRLKDQLPEFDLVIVDEAHYMRNFGRKQRKVGELLSQCSSAMIMLTATPVHLGDNNLFSLLNILDDEDFPDYYTAETRFKENEPIVMAQSCLGQIPPMIEEAKQYLKVASGSSLVKDSPLYNEAIKQIAEYEVNNSDVKKLIAIQKNVSELNLLGHIFTRTRKKEVHDKAAKRRAHAIELKFTPEEKYFYNAVSDFVQEEYRDENYPPFIKQWLLNMPQRRMASCIPAMVEYYRNQMLFDISDVPEDIDAGRIEDDYDLIDIDQDLLKTPRERLIKIISKWPAIGKDTKYDYLASILKNLKHNEGHCKIIIFAFFKDSLRYLYRRLNEENIKCSLLYGDTPPSERQKVIDDFKNNEEIEILLCSRVGSEGLDFQFCNTMFNYDLPWNPMEVEQRIGRLDRIGQQSEVIRIYNFWIEGTIEERILKRLYDRIGIFKRSIGELESIIGEIAHELESRILSKKLTSEEQEKEADIVVQILERKIRDLEKLENDMAKFIGTDRYFIEEVEAIKEHRRYVTGEQLRRFLADYISNYAPRTRFTYNNKTCIGKLVPDEKFVSLVKDYKTLSRLRKFLSASSEGVTITFNSDTAFSNPDIEFINILHPLIEVICDTYNIDKIRLTNAQYVCLETKTAPAGFYFYFVYRLKINAAQDKYSLESVIIKDDHSIVYDDKSAEIILGEMVENGSDRRGLEIEIDQKASEAAYDKAITIFNANVVAIRKSIEKSNDIFIDRRLGSLRSSYEKNINSKKKQLAELEQKNGDARIIRMHKSTIKRLESELSIRQQELEKKRTFGVEYDEIAAGVLEVI